MPKTPAERKAKYRASAKGIANTLAYRETNKKRAKELYELNKVEILEKVAIYRDNNREKLNARQRDYNKTPAGLRAITINGWIQNGIIDPDLSAVYDYYINQTNCMICDKVYLKTSDRNLDHDHTINGGDNIRYICCMRCNVHVVR
jgi:hypothetical protein